MSPTRIGFTATAPVNADVTFGAQIETAMRSNSSGLDLGPQVTTAGALLQINDGNLAKIFNVGSTNFSADDYRLTGYRVQGSSVTSTGGGVEQVFADTGARAYIAYRHLANDLGNREKLAYGVGEIADINVVITGLLVLF